MTTPLIETLSSYVPGLIKSRLSVDPATITAPVAEPLSAAVLFADISGFTALTERLARQGPAGTETLTQELNSYFGQLIGIITNHGGDVVKFAGDALTAIWSTATGDGNDANLADVTAQAVACALAIQTALQDYRTGNGESLALSIGVGAGNVTMVQVGGVYSRWEYLITGPPLAQVNRAEAQARPGEAVISPEAWQLLDGNIAGRPLQDGAMRLTGITAEPTPVVSPSITLPPESETALRAYIPGAILARLAAGQIGWVNCAASPSCLSTCPI